MRHTKGSSTLANDPKLCVVLFYLLTWNRQTKPKTSEKPIQKSHWLLQVDLVVFPHGCVDFPMAAFDTKIA